MHPAEQLAAADPFSAGTTRVAAVGGGGVTGGGGFLHTRVAFCLSADEAKAPGQRNYSCCQRVFMWIGEGRSRRASSEAKRKTTRHRLGLLRRDPQLWAWNDCCRWAGPLGQL